MTNIITILAALICGIIAGLAFSLADHQEGQQLPSDLNAQRVMAAWDQFEAERAK